MINSYIIFFIRHILLLVFFLSKPGEYPLTQNATPPQRIGWRFGCVMLVAASTHFASQRWGPDYRGLVRSFLYNSTSALFFHFQNVSSLDPKWRWLKWKGGNSSGICAAPSRTLQDLWTDFDVRKMAAINLILSLGSGFFNTMTDWCNFFA